MLLGPLQQAQQQDQQALVAQQAQAGQVALAQMLANQPNQQALMATSTPLPVPTAAAAPSDQTNGALV